MSRIIDRSLESSPGDVVSPERSLGWVPSTLLGCGVTASLLYGAMIWLIRFRGYSPISQTVSELSAWGVSTRPLWIVLGSLYAALMAAFAVGVLVSAGDKRALRTTSGLLLAYSLLGLAWPFAAMHPREVLAAGGRTLADTMHLVLAGVTVLLMFAAMAFGAVAFGARFRLYSIATIVFLLGFGALTSANASRVEADLPTPWAGLWERINIGVFLVWVVVLATALLLRNKANTADSAGRHQPTRTLDPATGEPRALTRVRSDRVGHQTAPSAAGCR